MKILFLIFSFAVFAQENGPTIGPATNRGNISTAQVEFACHARMGDNSNYRIIWTDDELDNIDCRGFTKIVQIGVAENYSIEDARTSIYNSRTENEYFLLRQLLDIPDTSQARLYLKINYTCNGYRPTLVIAYPGVDHHDEIWMSTFEHGRITDMARAITEAEMPLLGGEIPILGLLHGSFGKWEVESEYFRDLVKISCRYY